jgi:hypothetical protein
MKNIVLILLAVVKIYKIIEWFCYEEDKINYIVSKLQ